MELRLSVLDRGEHQKERDRVEALLRERLLGHFDRGEGFGEDGVDEWVVAEKVVYKVELGYATSQN